MSRSSDVARRTSRALEQLLGGFGTAVLALLLLVWLLPVVTLWLPATRRLLHTLTDRERRRLGRWGPEVPPPAVRDTRAELAWLARHAIGGVVVGFLAVFMPFSAVRDLSFPLWWWALPDGWASPSLGLFVVRTWAGVPAVVAFGLLWAVLTVVVTPLLARRQARVGRRLLGGTDGDLTVRVAELTASRAAALDAHATELRRIERALHDGTQNRLVATTVLLGAARRSLVTAGPEQADAALGRAQDAAESALAELRAVVRSILPPVLADRGLAGAVRGLAGTSPVPCVVEVDLPARAPAAVEATVYFAVSEALTNVARHSGARGVDVSLRQHDDWITARVVDDGRGGAVEAGGTGLTGIRRRVEAMDGRWSLSSPPGGPTELEVALPCGS